MKKTFVNVILTTSTAFVALVLAMPLSHLSAQNEVSIDPSKKVHKTTIASINFNSNMLAVDVEGMSIPVETNASTTILLGNGNQTEFTALRAGLNVYVFGSYDPVSKTILADKIVLRNKSKTERTSLSRAELERQSSPTVIANAKDSLGLTVK